MQKKLEQVSKYWTSTTKPVVYSEIDRRALAPFKGIHPEIMKEWLKNEAEHILNIDPHYRPTKKEAKHHFMQKIEALTGMDFSRKHFKLVA